MEYDWDIFIGYPGAENDAAKQLYDLLTPRCRVFLDTECLLPGDSWMEKIPAALKASLTTALLISSGNTPKAWYQNAEIAAAIRLVRDHDAEGHRVIPIYLDGAPQVSEKPYGLEPLVDLDASSVGGIPGVAQKLKTVLDKLGVPLPSEAPARAMARGNTAEFVRLRSELAGLLQRLFPESAMRDFIQKGPGGGDLQEVIIDRPTSKKALALSAIDALIRRDLVTHDLFQRMVERKSASKADIQKVEVQFFASQTSLVSEVEPQAQLSGQDPPADPRFCPNATMRVALGAALRLDRAPQWSKVVESCSTEGSFLFLLHGDSRQSLALFLDRVQFYLVDESHRSHQIYRVPLRIQGSDALSGDEWLTHIRHALDPQGMGNIKDQLTKQTGQQALLLILGQRPLYKLSPEQKEGVGDLLVRSWPELLERTRPANPVRLLLPIDYDSDDDPVITQLDQWGLQAEREGILSYVKLQQVKLPDWDEVEAYLDEKRPRPAADIVDVIRGEYDYLINSKLGDFKQLSERLDRHLGDLPQ